MGNASKRKAARAAIRAASVARSPLDLLLDAVEVIGDGYGMKANCAGAAAMLTLIGDELGFNLTPRPVSFIATKLSNKRQVLSGAKAAAAVARGQLIEQRSADPMENGHMVVTMEDPPMLFDPNLRQLGSAEIAAPSVKMSIVSTHPESGRWVANLPNLRVEYLIDDENNRLRKAYEEGLVKEVDNAKMIVKLLRQGLSVKHIEDHFKAQH